MILYIIIHRDERGIDVALLYDTTVFKVAYSKSYALELIDDFGVVDLTERHLISEWLI
ncbi:hypothetical protein N7U66_13885 [Lacinutrix neustonica]|uniref:Endonuclease/exonuclease/phosphatase domain-containing protein n=1 Tax=Lacinutrix neustonica TaxID=2980107 RepID=A0A9E8MVU1_9FLAO|nr:hypothetical protein [Lacinutrix neustonica]WAC01215.1 hypothetical protein N7U66_13885 [Lacinutrix neustonica]